MNKLFEKTSIAVAIWDSTSSSWADFGRGKLRGWVELLPNPEEDKKQEEKETTNSKDKLAQIRMSWLSLISIGTLKELLTVHTYRQEKIDNRVILVQKGTPLSTVDPEIHDEGILVSTTLNKKLFLFKPLGGSEESREKISKEIIKELQPYCKFGDLKGNLVVTATKFETEEETQPSTETDESEES